MKSRYYEHQEEKNLVAEQSGWSYLFSGLFLALFVGLSFRATFSDVKIHHLVNKAVQKIHPQIHVSVQTSYLSLSRGIFPELAVVLENIKVESQENCWFKPLIEVNEMRMPFSLKSLLLGKVEIRSLQVDQMSLSLRSVGGGADCSNSTHFMEISSAEKTPPVSEGVSESRRKLNEINRNIAFKVQKVGGEVGNQVRGNEVGNQVRGGEVSREGTVASDAVVSSREQNLGAVAKESGSSSSPNGEGGSASKGDSSNGGKGDSIGISGSGNGTGISNGVDKGIAGSIAGPPSQIDRLDIQSLQIHYLPQTFTSFELKNVVIKVRSHSPQIIESEGILNLGGGTLIGDYSSQAKFLLSYLEVPEKKLSLSLQGNWREGQYRLDFQHSLKNLQYNLKSSLQHIPLSQVLPLLNKYNIVRNNYNGHQIWTSFDIHSEGLITDWKKALWEIEGLRIEGSVGEIISKKIEISSLYTPVSFKPFSVELMGIDFNKIWGFLNRGPSPVFLGNLGIFNGMAQVLAPDHIQLFGDHSGIEFLFSNQGVNRKQVLSLVSGVADFYPSKWKIEVDHIRPYQGVFNGVMVLEADLQKEKVEILLKADEFSLGEEVSKLMTRGGDLGRFSCDLNFSFRKGQLIGLQGQFQNLDMILEGMVVPSSRFRLHTENSDFLIDMKVPKLKIPISSPVYSFFSSILRQRWLHPETKLLEVDNLFARMKTQSLNNFYWESVRGELAPFKGHFFSSFGGWDESNDVDGEVEINIPGGGELWTISGGREKLLWQRKK